jgi:hypothetical protein
MKDTKENTENKDTNSSYKSFCYNCDKDTNQNILFKEHQFEPQEIIFRNEEGDQSQTAWEIKADIWIISKCLGCERINFKHIGRRSPDQRTDDIFYFPWKRDRHYPKWIFQLPIKYLEILEEVYAAITMESNILALMGIRTVLDVYMVDKVGDVGNFKQKLNKLVEEQIISKSKVKVLEAAIEAGNASAHRGFKPDRQTLFQVLDIVENLLQSEVIDRDGININKKVPKRDQKNDEIS